MHFHTILHSTIIDALLDISTEAKVESIMLKTNTQCCGNTYAENILLNLTGKIYIILYLVFIPV